jgi:TolB-like protein
VVAKNLLGKLTKRMVVIHVDREGPMITLEELRFDENNPARGVEIFGSLYDEAGVTKLSINGQSVAIQEGVEVIFTKSLPMENGALELVAQDRLGNQTAASVPLRTSFLKYGPKYGKPFDEMPIPHPEFHSPDQRPVRLASADSSMEGFLLTLSGISETPRLQAKDKPKTHKPLEAWIPTFIRLGGLAGMTGKGNRSWEKPVGTHHGRQVLVARLFGSKDNRPPVIRLRGWTDIQTVFLEKVYIEGEVRDENKIESLTIDQTPILRRKGMSIFFSHLADLKAGENYIIIEASDAAGNKTSKKIKVIRRIPKALQLAERLSLTVLPFEQKGTVSEASLSFQDNLIDGLVNRNRFSVVERDKLDMILQEQKLSRTELIDRGTALKLGKLIAAQSIVTGSIIETNRGIEIVGRLIDTETSEILATEDVYDEVKDLPALRSLAEGMAIKFHRDFPLLDGLIIQQKGKDIFTDLGQDKIKIRRRLIIYREEPIKHPVTGKIMGADNIIIGRARVTQVMAEMSKAEILDGEASAIGPTDKVITE